MKPEENVTFQRHQRTKSETLVGSIVNEVHQGGFNDLDFFFQIDISERVEIRVEARI